MKILCVIDSLGSGGAQRQITYLACALKRLGHQVEVVVYYPNMSFFRPILDSEGIKVHELNTNNKLHISVIARIRDIVLNGRFEAVISFLGTPNLLVEIATLGLRVVLIVSERSNHLGERRGVRRILRRIGHVFADSVVSNSYSQNIWISERFPWLRTKCRVIYNGIDIDIYHDNPKMPQKKEELRLLAVGRVSEEKNITGIIRAMDLFHACHGWVPTISWVGRREDNTSKQRLYLYTVDSLLEELPHVRNAWVWLGERDDTPDLLRSHNALIHASFYEGLPNVICEAMAASRPVLASAVCDNERLIADGVRGFTFDPRRVTSITAALERLVDLTPDEWVSMCEAAGAYAREALGVDRMAREFEHIILATLSR